MGKGCLNDQQVTELVKILDKIMRDHDKRQMVRHGEYCTCSIIGVIIFRKRRPNGKSC